MDNVRWIEVDGHTIKAIENSTPPSIIVGLKGYYGKFANIHPSDFDSYVEGLKEVVRFFPAYFKALEDNHIITPMPDGVEDVGSIEVLQSCN